MAASRANAPDLLPLVLAPVLRRLTCFCLLARGHALLWTLSARPPVLQVELRVFCDWTLVEVYFQRGRVAMTTALLLNESTTLSLLRSDGLGVASGAPDVSNATLWPMKPIMTTPEAVRAAPRVYS